MPKVLTKTQSDQFWNDGYVFPFDCLTPEEARACRDKLEAYEGTLDDDITKHVRVKCHLAFRWLWDLAHHPKILDPVEDLIGPDILLYLSTFWFKDSKDGKFVSWHQDSAYYGLDPHDVITLWLGFTEATPQNGCMRILPGSHKWPDQTHDETYDGDNLLARGQTIVGLDDTAAVEMPLKAGQFSMHHERMLHSSGPNISDDRRLGMSFTYLPTRTRCLLGRRTAILVRGKDDYHHWDYDPEPRADLDPACMETIQHWIKAYADPNIIQEGRRAG
ncbi:MAG: phytanoyl-CoA dioxygenase family protein [Pseudomonadota bacterium]|nr:phytanoyl-CoA dioxygenase family protein [Pseudomonadota bacterium]